MNEGMLNPLSAAKTCLTKAKPTPWIASWTPPLPSHHTTGISNWTCPQLTSCLPKPLLLFAFLISLTRPPPSNFLNQNTGQSSTPLSFVLLAMASSAPKHWMSPSLLPPSHFPLIILPTRKPDHTIPCFRPSVVTFCRQESPNSFQGIQDLWPSYPISTSITFS